MKPPGPCRDCGHEDFAYPPCDCRADGCWCAASGVMPLDLPLPAHVLDRQTVLPVDLDFDDAQGGAA